mgnify:CR=1 FL=1
MIFLDPLGYFDQSRIVISWDTTEYPACHRLSPVTQVMRDKLTSNISLWNIHILNDPVTTEGGVKMELWNARTTQIVGKELAVTIS